MSFLEIITTLSRKLLPVVVVANSKAIALIGLGIELESISTDLAFCLLGEPQALCSFNPKIS